MLVAAAQKVDLKSKAKPRPVGEWQKDAWRFAKEVPEVGELIDWRGNQMAKLRWYAATWPVDAGPDAQPVPVGTEDSLVPEGPAAVQARFEMSRLKARVGGQSEIARRLDQNLETAGEAHVIGFGERSTLLGDDVDMPEEWVVASVLELDTKSRAGVGMRWIYNPGETKESARELDPDRDSIFRVWQPDSGRFLVPDCAMRRILVVCDTIVQLSHQMRALSRARMGAGIVKFPSGLKLQIMGAESAVEDTGDVMNMLAEYLRSTVEDPDALGTIVPPVISGEVADLEGLKFMTFDRPQDDRLDERIEKLIMRAARGLNAPVEVVTGLMATTFANAEQIDENTFDEYLEPRAVHLSDALTVGFLRPQMALTFPDVAEDVFVWFDASDLIGKPDRKENAIAAHTALAISDAALRDATGFDEGDAPDEGEILRRLGGSRGMFTPELTAALIQTLAVAAGVDLPDAAALAPSAPPQAQFAALTGLIGRLANRREAITVTASRRAPQNPGRRLADIDRDLRIRLLAAADGAMDRALEKAGNRLRSKLPGRRADLAGVAAGDVAAVLGRQAVTAAMSLDDLLDGGWDRLEGQFKEWGARAQDEALAVVYRLVSGTSAARRESLGARMAADLDEAWSWFRQALTALAGHRMFDPSPDAPPVGEFDPALKVPPSYVRHALALAGGNKGVETKGSGDAFVTLRNAGSVPAGGIGTGQTVVEELAAGGVVTESYLWDYGPSPRKNPFPAHVRLDGTEFAGWDDAVLANTSGFPETSFYMPGDHPGCQCDVVPLIRTTAGTERAVPEFTGLDA